MFLLTSACVTAVLVACGGSDDNNAADTQAPAAWAGIATTAVAQDAASKAPAPGLSPIDDSRLYAMAFSAAHDALNAIDRRYKPYLSDLQAGSAQPDAAVAAAMHDVLVQGLPSQVTYLDAQYAQALAAVPASDAKTAGIALGQQTAAAIIANRANDGTANAQGPYSEPLLPGHYQPTPPINQAAYVNEGQVKPFVLASSAQFRPDAPYAVTDAAYTVDFNEVKTIGATTSSVRTADQSEVAKFWLENTTGALASITVQLAAARHLNGWQLARALALVQLAEADSQIAGGEAKYHYRFWRPITAIRAADTDGNPDTVGDAAWTPFDPVTPPVPDYPSTHSTSAGAGEVALQAVFGGDAASFDHTSLTLPGVTRKYTSFSQLALEICNSRVWVGYHFRLATTVGRQVGQNVGQYVATHVLQPN